jgi:ADP-heptose:LPS heptosyltransferase
LLHLLSAWDITSPHSLESEIHTAPAQDALAARLLPENRIICHISSSQPKKEWPVQNWAAFHALALAAGLDLVFSAGLGEREQALLEEFRRLAPAAPVLPVNPDLGVFLAVLKRARAFVSGDTGPLHFAAGLSVPTLALFGPTSARQWQPWGPCHQVLTGGPCGCSGDSAICQNSVHCLSLIAPAQVLDRLRELLANRQKNCFAYKSGEHVVGIGT